jgi:hypothetical protein
VALPHPVRVLIHVVLGPPATEVAILHGQLAYEFSQRGVMGVAAGVEAKVGDDALGGCGPVRTE